MTYFDYSTMSIDEIMELWDKFSKKERNCVMDIEMGCGDVLAEKTLNFYRNAKEEIKEYVLKKFNRELV